MYIHLATYEGYSITSGGCLLDQLSLGENRLLAACLGSDNSCICTVVNSHRHVTILTSH